MNRLALCLLIPLVLLATLGGCNSQADTAVDTGQSADSGVRVDRTSRTVEGRIVAHPGNNGAREAIINLSENQRHLASRKTLIYPCDAPEQAVTATLRELSINADPTTRTYRARYVLHGAVQRFAMGSTVTVRLQGNREAE